MRAATFGFALALILGLALGGLLTGTGPGASGVVGSEYWILVITAASVYLGWQVAQLTSAPISLIAATVLVVVMIGVILGVKYARVPWAPLMGDGFAILVAVYAAAGVLGALAGRTPWLRVRTVAGAARTGLWLAPVIVAVSLATYALSSVMGS
jgi:hypothetical protein